MTYSKIKTAFQVGTGEKLHLVIRPGIWYNPGNTAQIQAKGTGHGYRCSTAGLVVRGIEAALLAPTAMNQQKFKFSLNGTVVSAKPGLGFYSTIDLGIAKYHFEAGAGKEQFQWLAEK